MIDSLRVAVERGLETDCQALADYIQAVVDGFSNAKEASRGLKHAMALLTPNHFPVILIPGVTGSGGRSINDKAAGSGFQRQYQDENPNADQIHHFAAFFQIGYTYGPITGVEAAVYWEALEGTLGNTGDILLGSAAALIGAQVHANELSPSDVADLVRNDLCRH